MYLFEVFHCLQIVLLNLLQQERINIGNEAIIEKKYLGLL